MSNYTKHVCDLAGVATLVVSGLDYLPQAITMIGGIVSIIYFVIQIRHAIKNDK